MTSLVQAPSPPRWWRQHSRGIGMSVQVITLALVVWLLVMPQLKGSARSLHLLFHLNNSWIVVALVAELASLGFYTLLTRAMLARETRPSLQRVMRIDLSAIALGHCLPDGGAAGTALSWRLLVGSGVPSSNAAFAKLAQGLGSAVVLQTLLLVSYLVGFTTSGFSRWDVVPAVVSAVILATFAIAALCLRRQSVRRRLVGVIGRFPRVGHPVTGWLTGLYRRQVVGQIRELVGRPRSLWLAACWAASNWSLDALALWASLRAYGHPMGLEALAVAYGVQALATWLPITPSGLGLSEALMIPALITFGSTRSAAILGILTWRVLAYWLPIPLGAIAFGSLRGLSRSAAASELPDDAPGLRRPRLAPRGSRLAPQAGSVPPASE